MQGHTHTHTQTQTKFHEYSRLHKLCFPSANSRQTFSQNAHEEDSLSPSSTLLSLPLSFSFTLSLSPRPLHQPCSLSIPICLISFLSISLPNPCISTSLYFSIPCSPHGDPIIFCITPPPFPFPPSPLSWGYWPTWHALMIIPITVRHPPPAWPCCLLIILLWSAQPEAWSTLSLLPFWPTNHSSHYFMHSLERLTTFDLIT